MAIRVLTELIAGSLLISGKDSLTKGGLRAVEKTQTKKQSHWTSVAPINLCTKQMLYPAVSVSLKPGEL